MSDLCDEYSEDADAFCVRQCGHDGLHQSRVCDGTCDTCDCYEWPNDDGEARTVNRTHTADAAGEGDA